MTPLFPAQTKAMKPSLILRALKLQVNERGKGVAFRKILPEADWNRIRRSVYQKAGYCCEICGGQGPEWPVACTPMWEYLSYASMQVLLKFVALCPECLDVWRWQGNSRVLNDARYDRLRDVNGWTLEKAHLHVKEARSLEISKKWRVNVHILVDRYQIDAKMLEQALGGRGLLRGVEAEAEGYLGPEDFMPGDF